MIFFGIHFLIKLIKSKFVGTKRFKNKKGTKRNIRKILDLINEILA